MPTDNRKPFFSWINFGFGLAVAAALVGSFYFGLSPAMTVIVVGSVALALAGVGVLIIKARLNAQLKKLEHDEQGPH